MLPHDVAGRGPAVLLLHNGLCDRRMWDRQMETFAASHLVVRCDLPGYGEAPVPTGPFSPAEEVLAVLDALGVDRAALVGNSLGGGFALDVCLATPGRVSALALVGAGRAGWAWSDALRRAWSEEQAAVQAGDLDRAVELSLRMWLDGQRPPGSVGGPVRDRVAEMQRLALKKARAAGPAEPAMRLAEGSPSDVRVPTLVLVGEQDWPDMLDVAEAYAREIPGAHRVVMPGVAHIPAWSGRKSSTGWSSTSWADARRRPIAAQTSRAPGVSGGRSPQPVARGVGGAADHRAASSLTGTRLREDSQRKRIRHADTGLAFSAGVKSSSGSSSISRAQKVNHSGS